MTSLSSLIHSLQQTLIPSSISMKANHKVMQLQAVTEVVLGSAYLETESHYFAGQTVSPEESLHGVGQLHFFGEHVPQQLVQQVAGVEQGHQDSG